MLTFTAFQNIGGWEVSTVTLQLGRPGRAARIVGEVGTCSIDQEGTVWFLSYDEARGLVASRMGARALTPPEVGQLVERILGEARGVMEESDRRLERASQQLWVIDAVLRWREEGAGGGEWGVKREA